jgi:hypothetical protein
MLADIRESYRAFPEWTNPFWTWLTGKPRHGEHPKFVLGPWGFMFCSLLSYVVGIAMALQGMFLRGWWSEAAVAVGYILAVSGSRRLVSTVVHQCIHGRFSGGRAVDHWVGEAITLVTLTQTADEYKREHFAQHHRYGVFTTQRDPAAKFLQAIGFVPGRSRRSLWGQLVLNFGSPHFHGHFLLMRLKSNFIAARGWRLLASYVYLAAWVGIAAWVGVVPVLVAFGIPIVCLYQLSVMLEFISEHAWFVPVPALSQANDVHGTHSWGRFCGAAVPSYEACAGPLAYFAAMLRWGGAHLFYHLPVRLLVLPGDLPQHDFHHRHPGTVEWTRAAYSRHADLASAESNGVPYKEFWGLHRAVDHVFAGITAARYRAPESLAAPLPTQLGANDDTDGARQVRSV